MNSIHLSTWALPHLYCVAVLPQTSDKLSFPRSQWLLYDLLVKPPTPCFISLNWFSADELIFFEKTEAIWWEHLHLSITVSTGLAVSSFTSLLFSSRTPPIHILSLCLLLFAYLTVNPPPPPPLLLDHTSILRFLFWSNLFLVIAPFIFFSSLSNFLKELSGFYLYRKRVFHSCQFSVTAQHDGPSSVLILISMVAAVNKVGNSLFLKHFLLLASGAPRYPSFTPTFLDPSAVFYL